MKETSFVDQPTDKDSLGIENYIKGLSNFIRRCTTSSRSEERRVGKECRSRWSPYH